MIVGRVAAFTFTLVFLVVDSTTPNDERTLEVIRKLLGPSLDGLLRDVDRPFVILDIFRLVDLFGLSVDPTSQFVIAPSFERDIAVLSIAIIRRTLARTATAIFLDVTILLGVFVLATLLGRFILLALLRLVLQDEGAQLEANIDVGPLATGLAIEKDAAILEDDIRLRILALLTENELGDETVQVVLKLRSLMSTVDDPTIVRWIRVGLSAKLEAKILDHVCAVISDRDIGLMSSDTHKRGATQRLRDATEIDNDRLDPVPFTFNLGHEAFHLVPIEGIGHILEMVSECDLYLR